MLRFLDIVRHDCGPRYDANETAAFSRELEYVHAEVIAAKYPEFKGRNMVPIKSGAPLGATSHRWFEVDGFGKAAYLDNLATDDFPTQEVQGAENTGKIRSIGAKYMVTVEDLRAAAMMKVNVEAEKARLARRSIEGLIDQTIVGKTATLYGGFSGVAHDNNSTAYTPDATAGSNGNWFTVIAAGTPEKVVNDVQSACEAAFIETKGAFQQFDLFLPPELGVLLNRPMSILVNSVRTNLLQNVGQYMLSAIPYLRSISTDCFRLSGAGATNKHRVLLYPRDPEVLDFFIPLDLEQFAPQLSGMAFVTHLHSKVGGLRVKHKKAIRRFDSSTS